MAAAAPGSSSRASSRSRAPRCSPTTSSSAPRRRSRRSQATACPSSYRRTDPARDLGRVGLAVVPCPARPKLREQDDADRVLYGLERTRAGLERTFPRLLRDITVALHGGPLGLAFTFPPSLRDAALLGQTGL